VLSAVCEQLKLCFSPDAPGAALTDGELRAWALKRAPGERCAAGKGADAAAEAGGAPAVDSPPTAHDSASSHHMAAGTAQASRKRGLDGGAGSGEQQQQQKQQQQQQQQQQAHAAAWAGDGGGGDAKRVRV
jgi:hypothetical protein